MNKYYYVTTFIIVLLVSFIGITYSYEDNTDGNLNFKLIGPEVLYMDVNTDYIEYGVEVNYNNRDISNEVNIDNSNVNINELGEYQVKYLINISGMDEYIYRTVKVIDEEIPKIELVGGDEIDILLNGSYLEYGYVVTDNYDTDLHDKVNISGSVNTKKKGSYKLIYSVTDSSGNKAEVTRIVNVKESVITLESASNGILTPNSYNVTNYSNTIVKNSFNNNGIYYYGYVKEKSDAYKIKLKKKNSSLEYVYNMVVDKDNYYSGNLDLTTVANGEYSVYIVGKNEIKLLNKLNVLSKIVRAKIGNKLVTVLYDNDVVSIKIDDFKYKYDILIDPGHGSVDVGASNGIVLERDINLLISKYEKCRYESMGYSVYLIRNDDSYGEMLGDESLDNLSRRALAIGYYGAVSKISYSNHHNSSYNTTDHGFEILVSNSLSNMNLTVEMALYNKLIKLYGITDNDVRVYSRDYETGKTYNKINGIVYSDNDYYAVIRIPYQLYNVKNIIYEPIYMSNFNDFNWYWSNKNWIKVSEAKIEEYVNYLGGTYNSDNSKCL